MRPTTRGRRLAAVTTMFLTFLTFAVVLATPGAAGAVTTEDPAGAAAGWLGRQLDHHRVTTEFGTDYGATADVVLALHSAKVGRVAAGRATRVLRRHVLDYTGGGDANEFYAGSFAKLLVVATARGGHGRAFGGSSRRDLVAGLLALECGQPNRADCANAEDRGRFSDRSTFGDFSNTITQSLAVIGLVRSTQRGPSAASVAFLRGQQCANGAFPERFGGLTCTPSVDATGFAVQALAGLGDHRATAAAAEAGRWLKRHQHRNGSFTGNGVRNANSTALAAQGLSSTGHYRSARAARAFVRSLQRMCAAASADRGLVRYDRADSGDELRATAQAVPALARTTLVEITKAGSRRRLPHLAC